MEGLGGLVAGKKAARNSATLDRKISVSTFWLAERRF